MANALLLDPFLFGNSFFVLEAFHPFFLAKFQRIHLPELPFFSEQRSKSAFYGNIECCPDIPDYSLIDTNFK